MAFAILGSIDIPKPFSRVAVSLGRNIEVPLTEDPLLIEAKRLEVEATLERVRLNAEQHFLKAINMQSPYEKNL